MEQLTVKKLKEQIESMPDDMPVFFRRIAPVCGTIEIAGLAKLDEFAFFGMVEQCVIIEPLCDDDDE